MTQKSGLAFHVHHDTLIEYCTDYDDRVDYIKKYKPFEQRELRLWLFQLIPIERLPQDGLKAYIKAWRVGDKAREEAREAYEKPWEVYDKAREAYVKTKEAHDKAWKAYLSRNQRALEKLHEELCLNCPWDGKTIFPKEKL